MAGSYGGRISLEPTVAQLVCESSAFAHPLSNHRRFVLTHPLNYAVEVTVPRPDGGPALPPALEAVAPTADVFYTADVTAAELLEPVLRGLIAAGTVSIVSLHANPTDPSAAVAADGAEECAVAVLPAGTLVLTMGRRMFHSLGLPGRPSVVDPEARFVVTIDLTDPALDDAASKRGQRLRWALTDRLELRFRVAAVWDGGSGGAECPELAALDSATRRVLEVKERVYKGARVPLLEEACAAGLQHAATRCRGAAAATADEKEEEAATTRVSDSEAAELSEWLGSISCHLDLDGSSDAYHSTLGCPEPSRIAPRLLVRRWHGLVTARRVTAMLEAAVEAVADGTAPWIAVTVWGFQDAPVSWGPREHGFSDAGENHYTVVVGPGGRYLRFTALDPADPAS